jgi:hypothetical protein
MDAKTYKQFGTYMVVIFLVFLLIISIIALKTESSSFKDYIIPFGTLLTIISCLLHFYQLTIRVSDESVSFKMGVGLFGKTYPISEIESCYEVTTSLLNGFGIRMISNGWLYNVSGNKAIELHFKNKTSVVRIGTDKPEEIASFINSKLK